MFPSPRIPTLSPTNGEAKERPLRGPGTLAGTRDRDVVVLRGVARGVWLMQDRHLHRCSCTGHGLRVVLNMLRAVILIVRAQLSLVSEAYR